MRPEKFGIAVDSDLANYLWEVAGKVRMHRNAVVVRILQIGRADLAPFEGKVLKTIMREPWQKVSELPALRREMEKHSHARLSFVAGVRLTGPDYVALRSFAEEHETTISAGLRQIVHRILATEA